LPPRKKSTDRATARREQEETARLAAQREANRLRARRLLLTAIAFLVVVLFLVYVFTRDSGSGKKAVAPAPTSVPFTPQPGGPALSTAQPPWALPADAGPYITAAGLAALPEESLAVHYHAHLDVLVDGKPVTVPSSIGVLVQGGRPTGISPLHTHDANGVLHIEAPSDIPFTLGQVMAEWGVRLTKDCLGGLCAGGGKTLRLVVDGTPYAGADPAALVLRPHQEVALVYGDPAAATPVPSRFEFPRGQ
jgi:hypothetical protein